MGEPAAIPDTVIALDVITALRATPVWSVNVNGSGIMSTRVVTLKMSDTPPMVSVASVFVEKLDDDVCCTVTVLPLATVPLELTYAPPLMEYVPPVIEMGDVVFIPDTLIALDVITALTATPVWSVNVNASGIMSTSVVTLKVSDTPPMVSTAFVVVEKLDDEVCRTVTVLLFATDPPELVYAPPLME